MKNYCVAVTQLAHEAIVLYYISIPIFDSKKKFWKVLNRDVRGTSVRHVFWIQLKNTLNLLWQVTQDFIVNGSNENFGEQYSGSKNNLNKNSTRCAQGEVIKVWLEDTWKSFSLNIFKNLTPTRISPSTFSLK